MTQESTQETQETLDQETLDAEREQFVCDTFDRIRQEGYAVRRAGEFLITRWSPPTSTTLDYGFLLHFDGRLSAHYGLVTFNSERSRDQAREILATLEEAGITNLDISCITCGQCPEDCACDTDGAGDFGSICDGCGYVSCTCDEQEDAPRIATDFDGPIGTRTPAYPRSVGVELEITGAVTWTPIERFCGSTGSGIVHDGSLTSSDKAGEIVVRPAIGGEVPALYRKLGVALSHAAIATDSTCGLHIHVGVGTNLTHTVPRLLTLWHKVEGEIFSRYAPSRTDNEYCAPIASNLVRLYQQVLAGTPIATYTQGCIVGPYEQHSRYVALNLQSLRKHKTVEFRLFSPVYKEEAFLERVRVVSRLVSLAARRLDIKGILAMDTGELIDHLASDNAEWSHVFRPFIDSTPLPTV